MQQIKENSPVFITRHLYSGLIILFVIGICAVAYTFTTAGISRTSKLAGIGLNAAPEPLLTKSSLLQADSFYQPLVLCYHQVRDWKATDSKSDRAYIMPVNTFNEHMKALYESGYRTLLPDQWMDYMKRGERLPEKCFILTFDDGTRGQYTNALSLMNRYHYQAVFFIMTVSIDKSQYLTREQIKDLTKAGHVIGCHTWDHHDVRFLKEADWYEQVVKPNRILSDITGGAIKYFAYPYGSWNSNAIQQLKKNTYEMAFQLNGPYEAGNQIFTVRRISVDGRWNRTALMKAVSKFNVR